MSQLYISLYDTKNGGGARAFQCRIKDHEQCGPECHWHCNRVCRTERGMWSHLRQAHGIERQPGLFAK